MKKVLFLFCMLVLQNRIVKSQEAIIIDHTVARISKLKSIPLIAINQAKSNLHIWFEHTSHGSQLLYGMNKLDAFMGGKNIYCNLDLVSPGTCDLYACQDTWVQTTKDYLDNLDNANCNVIMWSWCALGSEANTDPGYCTKMESLIAEYGTNGSKILSGARTVPVQFVFMTGHVNNDNGETKQINDFIRNYCIKNKRILYDFADIESWNPDNVSFVDKNVRADCSYDKDDGTLGNWAEEWIIGKVEMNGPDDTQHNESNGGQWFDCVSPHTHALNANLKAFAAWYLFARLAGWSDQTTSNKNVSANATQFRIFPNPAKGIIKIENLEMNYPVQLSISALNGTKLKEIQCDSNSQQIDISGIPSGVYVCSIRSKDSSFVQKLVIQ
jgi:hypothetical protein